MACKNTEFHELESKVNWILENSDKIHMNPWEDIRFNINDTNKIKVHCYCWLVRRYSYREDWECVCHSNNHMWLYESLWFFEHYQRTH